MVTQTTIDRHLRVALAYASRGWRVLPLRPGEKTPACTHGCLDATTDEEQIRRWWVQPDLGVGIATGFDSGLWVLDIDGPVGAVVWWHWEAQHGAAHTLAQRTGRVDGGRQLFFQWPEGVTIKSRAGVMPGIDVRGEGGYVVAPPSVHPSGRRYRWEGRVDVAAAPEALLVLVGAEVARHSTPPTQTQPVRSGATPYGQRAADDLEREMSACSRGGRDHLAFRTAVRLLELESSHDLPPGESEGVLRRALGRCGYLADERRERGESGLQRILRSARERVR